mgnify:CR=1 FL=1|jgi:hypothetical protein
MNQSFFRRPTVCGLIAGLLFAMTPLQVVPGSVAGARYSAAALFLGLRNQGWTCRDTFSQGLLRRGGSVVIATTLYAGNSYCLAASGCEDAYDVDLAVYDENGRYIGSDTDSTRLAIVRVAPRWTGTYYLKVTMANSTYNGAHYVMQYAYR